MLHAQKYKFVDFLYTVLTPMCKIPMNTQLASRSHLLSDNFSQNSCVYRRKAKEIHGRAMSEKIKYRRLALLKG